MSQTERSEPEVTGEVPDQPETLRSLVLIPDSPDTTEAAARLDEALATLNEQ